MCPHICHVWFSVLRCIDLITQFCATDVLIFLTGMFQICTLNLIYSIRKRFHLLFHCFSTLVMFRFRNHLCQSYAILFYLAQVKTTVYALLKISSPHPKLSYLVCKKIVRIKVKTYTEDWKSQTIRFPSMCTLCCPVKVLMLLTALSSPAQLLQPSHRQCPWAAANGNGWRSSSLFPTNSLYLPMWGYRKPYVHAH